MATHPLPIMRGRYVKGQGTRKAIGHRLAAHLKYNEYRKLGEQETREDRYIFSQDNDHVQRRAAVDDVMSHINGWVSYHKVILSPGEHEHIADFRQWTREIMNDLQDRKGVQLHWYAVVQAHPREHTNEPHVHLVLAGSGEDPTGNMRAVRMDSPDYTFLREQGREHSNFDFYQALEQELRELERADPVMREGEQDHVSHHER